MKELIKKREEEFDTKYGIEKTTNHWKGFAEDIKNFNRETIKQIIQSDIEELEGMKYKLNDKMAKTILGKEITDIYKAKDAGEIVGYHQAIDDLIEKKQQQLKEL